MLLVYCYYITITVDILKKTKKELLFNETKILFYRIKYYEYNKRTRDIWMSLMY